MFHAPDFVASVAARYTHIFISARKFVQRCDDRKTLSHPVLRGTTCRCGEIPAIISPDGKTTALRETYRMNLRPLCLVFSNLVLPLVLLLFGCATPPNNTQPEVVEAEDFNDPLEDTNRA